MTQEPHPHPAELWLHVRGGGGVPHKDRGAEGVATQHSGPLVLGGEGVDGSRGLARILGGRSMSTAVGSSLPLCPRDAKETKS